MERKDPEGWGDEAGRALRRTLGAGVLLYVLGVLILGAGEGLPTLDALALPAFLVLLPTLAVAQLPMLEGEEVERLPAYLGSIVGIVFLGIVGLVLGLRLEGPEGLGLVPPPTFELLAWAGGLTAGGVGLMALFHWVEKSTGRAGSPILRQLLPQTGREKGLFVVLSFAAGTGEEVAYRGYVLVALMAAGLSPAAAAVLSSVAFGFLHAYQGDTGIVRSGALGLFFAWAVLASGSLVPVMIAHFALDLLGGLVLGERWLGAPLAEGGEGN